VIVLVSAAAGNKSATRPPLSPPACTGEWKQTGRKLVGRDKGSLTEQQTEGNSNNNDTDKGNTQNKPHDPTEAFSQRGPALHAAKPRESSRQAAPLD